MLVILWERIILCRIPSNDSDFHNTHAISMLLLLGDRFRPNSIMPATIILSLESKDSQLYTGGCIAVLPMDSLRMHVSCAV